MKVYIGHSTNFDFKEKLYQPLKQSTLTQDHDLVFPHKSEGLFDSKSFLRDEADLMIAEVSHASTGLGIELGWADSFDVPVICIHGEKVEPSTALEALDAEKMEYKDMDELVGKLKEKLQS